MPTEIIPTASGSPDILPWVLVALLACMCAYLTYRLITAAKPKSSFEDWEACKKLNAEEGTKSAGRWVFLIVLGIDGHIISTERAERFEGGLYRRSGKKIWETKPGTIWNLGGVPTAFVWSDRYTALDIEAGAAIVKKRSLREILRKENPEEKTEDPILSRDGWYTARTSWDDNQDETVGEPWHIVPVDRMRDLVAPTSPSMFFNIATRINSIAGKKSGGLLKWILDNPLLLVLIVAGIAFVVLFLPKMM